jgi:exoribonuclease-2
MILIAVSVYRTLGRLQGLIRPDLPGRTKVEREMSKRLAAVAMSQRIGETFAAIVTGVTPHGTFVRVMQPHIEGLLTQGHQGLDVGDQLRAKLTRTDVQHGYIDFAHA